MRAFSLRQNKVPQFIFNWSQIEPIFVGRWGGNAFLRLWSFLVINRIKLLSQFQDLVLVRRRLMHCRLMNFHSKWLAAAAAARMCEHSNGAGRNGLPAIHRPLTDLVLVLSRKAPDVFCAVGKSVIIVIKQAFVVIARKMYNTCSHADADAFFWPTSFGWVGGAGGFLFAWLFGDLPGSVLEAVLAWLLNFLHSLRAAVLGALSSHPEAQLVACNTNFDAFWFCVRRH